MKNMKNSFILTIMNIGFIIILLLFNTDEEFGSLLHQMIVFFSIILFFCNIFILYLSNRLNKILILLSRYDIMFLSIVIYIISLSISIKIDTSNDLLINLMFGSSFFVSLTIFIFVRRCFNNPTSQKCNIKSGSPRSLGYVINSRYGQRRIAFRAHKVEQTKQVTKLHAMKRCSFFVLKRNCFVRFVLVATWSGQRMQFCAISCTLYIILFIALSFRRNLKDVS